ncbi:hypothetical protein Cgig2_010141 [Carnegiea gigantea]|uniref:Translation initiation factor IF-2, chloroplastic n=1 Tax=Carnegiea gigantea TaxID=171969 RepID=A0A9Q1KFE8_9CARY|nr:hypothetical protein Cgig2_010141 [Carnegiea gigantea]
MAAMASLVSLGSCVTSSSGNFEVSFSLVKRVSFPRRVCHCNFRHSGEGNRWRYVSVCRFSVITDYIPDQGNAVSLENPYGGSKDEDKDLILKPSPKHVLKSGSETDPQLEGNSAPWKALEFNAESNNGNLNDVVERKKVIESLDKVLEKAERLETGNLRVDSRKESSPVNRPAPVASNSANGKPAKFSAKVKPNSTRSVWRRGDPVSAVQQVIQEPLKLDKTERAESRVEGQGKLDIQAHVALRPLPSPQKGEIKLQARPSVAPPLVPKEPVLKDAGTPLATDGNDQNVKTKERKPILIDKFASKKAAVDPMIAQAVVALPKPSKIPGGKFKDDYRKKSAPAGKSKRRLVAADDDMEIDDEDISKLGVSIPGGGTARKGRKWSKARRKAARRQAARNAAPVRVEILEVEEKGMSTEELAYNLAIGEGELLGYLYSKGVRFHGLRTLDRDIVKMVCEKYNVEVLDVDPMKVEEMAKKKEIFDEDDLDKLKERPPVITIMGHVDHGKTTLLDYIRKSKVAASEAGGITQGIGAYKVQVPFDGKSLPCIFLDTPGHEAFGAMRARGARVTDIAVIVVAADDGIRPQTNEAIAHAKAAGVPIVIAINKIDKDGASPDRVMQELSSIGLMPEEWGGDIPMVKISALRGENIDDLLETIMLVAELQELKANPDRTAKGTVIEAGLDKSKGPVATFIVQNGTLRTGDIVVCGEAVGKVRALFDDRGIRVDEAGPSIPVQVIGLNNVPLAGDEFEVVSSLDIAREKAEARAEALREEHIAAKAGEGKITLSSLASAVSAGMEGLDLHQLNIILKVDVQGSIEAVRQALEVLPQNNVSLKFLLQAAGDVSASDVDLALASKAIILGFNVKAPGSVKKYAENKGAEIRLYRVIYELIDDVRSAMEGLLDPIEEQVPIGTAEVRATFSSGSGRVAGCMVTEGKVVKGCGLRVVRKGKTLHTGVLDSLRRVKETVEEVGAGLECGIGMEDFDDFEEGDILKAFNTRQKRRTLEEASAQIVAALEGAGIRR